MYISTPPQGCAEHITAVCYLSLALQWSNEGPFLGHTYLIKAKPILQNFTTKQESFTLWPCQKNSVHKS